MANSELFIAGDARFLSGGAPHCREFNYNRRPPVVTPGEEVTTDVVNRLAAADGRKPARDLIADVLAANGQSVRCGRDPYHYGSWHPGSSSMVPNVFVTPDAAPTAGVEIETYVRRSAGSESVVRARERLKSNWFRFEEDGSLDRTYGHELITDVLPPRVYRDLRLWTGLQNLVGPYLESYEISCTGLHVHVGMGQFDSCDALPVARPEDRRALAKYMLAFVYHGLLSPEYLDKVFLRVNGTYCSDRNDAQTVTFASMVRSFKDGIAASEVFDMLFAQHCHEYQSGVIQDSRVTVADLRERVRSVQQMIGGLRLSSDDTRGTLDFPEAFNSHGVELNFGHPMTVEFRRGKGTTNAVSVHRMVELCTLIVRYVWSLARVPSRKVTAESVYGFILANTNSEALRKVTEKQLARLGKDSK